MGRYDAGGTSAMRFSAPPMWHLTNRLTLALAMFPVAVEASPAVGRPGATCPSGCILRARAPSPPCSSAPDRSESYFYNCASNPDVYCLETGSYDITTGSVASLVNSMGGDWMTVTLSD